MSVRALRRGRTRGSSKGPPPALALLDALQARARWLIPLLLALVTLLAFLPTVQNGFVDWDDTATLVENPSFAVSAGPSSGGCGPASTWGTTCR